MQKIAVVVPAYNNPLTIKSVAKDVLSCGYELIIVDDGSNKVIESMFKLDERKNTHFIRHNQNEGKGNAIISGMKKAKELGYDYAGCMDGDSQHLASQMKKLVEIYQDDQIIIGARNFNVRHVPNGSKFGRWFSNFWACWDTGYKITDSLSGFRIYPISILDLKIKTSRFDWEMEVLVRHADAKKKINEIGIECHYPDPKQRVSHFRKFEDTVAIVWVHVQILPFKWFRFLSNIFIDNKNDKN